MTRSLIDIFKRFVYLFAIFAVIYISGFSILLYEFGYKYIYSSRFKDLSIRWGAIFLVLAIFGALIGYRESLRKRRKEMDL
jgi:TRAP-type C4-dicarboxylate transport system permease small subunit